MLKQKVLTHEQSEVAKNCPKTQLRGIWKGVEISDQLLEEAKRSLISKDFRDKEQI
ncbi:hypothetical protein [Phormidesmis priestleyi]|uniref:hypothetical protein n=1 Tax=Phormidesmis priestleyi TaxID=268141 RepID=UPI000A6414F6|nr:hypothetical protein [Phormidesmis priestleyi]